MAFDGIVTKAVASELQQLSGARIDKIFQPNKNNVILGFYFGGKNYALNICTNPSNYRIHLTTHQKSNPYVAPNFCMVLRKHLIGLHIKNFITNDLERIITIEFEGFDDIDNLITKKLIIELMGKHCNIILTDENNIIIDSLRHINGETSTHIIVPHVKYEYPIIKKNNILNCLSFEQFLDIIQYNNLNNINELPDVISSLFNGISKRFIENIIIELSIKTIDSSSLEKLYNYINNLIYATDSFKTSIKKSDKSNDYFIILDDSMSDNAFKINFLLDDFYYKKETSEQFKTSRDNILKIILQILKKYKVRLNNINKKLVECNDMDIYRLYGELITSNLYKIKSENISEIEIENYYDNNKLIKIPLNKKFSPVINARMYFKKYNKLKNALEIVSTQKKETENELEYIESIVYELESSSTLDDITDIFNEISENVVFKDNLSFTNYKKDNKIKKSKLTKNKNVSFNPIKYTIKDFKLLIGRNNKENDYLTLKYAHKSDIWFHTKDIHGSHGVLITNQNNILSFEILNICAEIVAYHSKARNSSNVPVDYCEIKYVKKPKGSKPGMVVYTNYNTLYVNPHNKKL